MVRPENERFSVDIHVERLAAEDDCEHFTFSVGVSLFAVTKGLAGKRDGLSVLNENGAESSAGGVDLDDTRSTQGSLHDR